MRKIINLILGALIAVLAGCKTQQPVKQDRRPTVMYGPPAYFQQQAQPNDTTQNNIEQTQNS
jgi:hypothetical protein